MDDSASTSRESPESDEIYRSLFRQLHSGAAYCRLLFEDGKAQDAVFLMVNDAFARHTGLHDVVGRRVTEAVPAIKAGDPGIFDRCAKVPLAGATDEFEAYSDLLKRWFRVSLYCPRPEHVIVLLDDITERKKTEAALRRNEDYFRALTTAISDVGYYMSADWSEMRQLRGGHFIPDTYVPKGDWSWLHAYIPPGEQPRVLAAIHEAIRNKSVFELEHQVLRVDGSTGWTFSRAAPLLDEHGDIVEWVGVASDVTERKKTEEELKLAAAVYKYSSEAMLVLDENRNIIMVNQAFTDITGYEPADVIGKHPRLLRIGRLGDAAYKEDDAFYQELWRQADENGRFKGETWQKRKDGQYYAVQLTVNTVSDKDGQPRRYVVLMSDITEKKRSDDLIWTQANFDALTGLPNRRFFRERLEHEVRNARRSNLPLALLFIDLDGFKHVNDTLGHDMGDLLLKEAADRLYHCVRGSDTVARLGGDEFTIILTELHDPRNVDRVARHILRALAEPIRLGEELAYVSASIGITLFPNDADQVEDLIKNADQAMYAAKQEGRNQYHFFTQEMQDAAVARMRLINDLRGALEGNQFEIAYQPIIDMATGKIRKAEALIRWRHPVHGHINPIDFISAAEDTGMIASFGNWVFHEAARQAAEWRGRYHPEFQISVNISPVQFRKEGIDLSSWLEHLKSLGLPGQGVVVEITERLLLEENPKVREQLLMLRDAGIEVALDDFGVGYSSLSYLKKFDIDYIKIDKTFIRNVTSDPGDMALCEAMVMMAHRLGLKVIAEGVEIQKQRELLAGFECDFAQGYLFSKPVPAAEFEQLLKADPFSHQEQLKL